MVANMNLARFTDRRELFKDRIPLSSVRTVLTDPKVVNTCSYHCCHEKVVSPTNEMRFTDRKTHFRERIPLLSIRSIRTDPHMAYTDRYGAGVLDNPEKERTLSKTKKVQYPVVRSEIRTYLFDGNSTRWSQDSSFLNKVPIKVIIGLMYSTNYNGSLQHYPYAYEKFGVTRVRQSIDGKEYPYRALELTVNFSAEDLIGYDRFLTASGAYNHHRVPMLQPGD